MAHGVSRNSVESMKLVIQTEETDLMLFVNSLKLSCQKYIQLSNLSVVNVSYQPYSPNPVPADFFLFPGVKTTLEQRFKDIEDITEIYKDTLHIT